MKSKDIEQFDAPEKNTKPKFTQVKKNIVICHVSDSSGCGHIRTIFPMNYLNAVFGKQEIINPIITPMFINQTDILVKTRSVLFQRQMTNQQLDIIKEYKRMQKAYKYKMIYDIDDMLWGENENQGGDKFHGIPSYSFSSKSVTQEMKESSIEIMKLVDLVTVSTEYLKTYLSKIINTPIQVVSNTVPMYLYGHRNKKDLTKNIKKPVVLYNGAPGHYSNEKKLKGDFNNAWYDWIIKSVKNDEIDLQLMGGTPWFLEEFKDKTTSYGWVNSFQYSRLLQHLNPDFIISPLTCNEFNSAKSDIKYIESCAVGAIHVGTTFSRGDVSPYDKNVISILDDCSVNDLDELFETYKQKDNYNRVINSQYDMLESDGRYTESQSFVKKIAEIF